MNQRERYTKEFKQDEISLFKDQGYKQEEAAESLGIRAPMLSLWIKENEDVHAFRDNRKLATEHLEIRTLKAKVKRLEMVNDILKKQRYSLQPKYSLITQHRNTYSIDWMCQLLGVKCQGFYSSTCRLTPIMRRD